MQYTLAMTESTTDQSQLLRSLSLTEISFYGIGTILGAGIYVLLGKVVGESGTATPVAFLLSAIVVSFSAYSYAQMSRQFPQSAGEAVYIMEGLHSRMLAALGGYAIILGGIVSAATIARGFTGYFEFFSDLPQWVSIILLVVALSAVAGWGVKQSVYVVVATTLLEISGLVLVFIAGGDNLADLSTRWREFIPTANGAGITATLSGAFLAFYAFIGFEDMVNMAEEVKQPERNLPLGIAIALVVTVLLYAGVAVVAILTLSVDELANSAAPLALLVERNSSIPVEIMAMISLIAIINGAMIQIIMASRVLYGMARRKVAPALLGRVHPFTRTPLTATLITGVLVICFALWLPITTLAKFTSFLLLLVFTLVNLSLLALNCRQKNIGMAGRLIPATGALVCVAFAAFQFLR